MNPVFRLLVIDINANRWNFVDSYLLLNSTGKDI